MCVHVLNTRCVCVCVCVRVCACVYVRTHLSGTCWFQFSKVKKRVVDTRLDNRCRKNLDKSWLITVKNIDCFQERNIWFDADNREIADVLQETFGSSVVIKKSKKSKKQYPCESVV